MAGDTKAATRRKRARSSPQHHDSRRLLDDILAMAATLARGRQDYGAGKLMTLASSTREFADSLNDMPNLRAQAASVAESLDGLAQYVMHTDIEQMAKDAKVFARRHPATTLAIAAVAGIAASSLVRSNGLGFARKPAPRRKRATVRADASATKSRRRANGQAHASG